MNYFNIAHFGWPQWIYLITSMLSVLAYAALHGKPMIDKETGQPEKYNGVFRTMNFAFIMFLLIAGGFFK